MTEDGGDDQLIGVEKDEEEEGSGRGRRGGGEATVTQQEVIAYNCNY